MKDNNNMYVVGGKLKKILPALGDYCVIIQVLEQEGIPSAGEVNETPCKPNVGKAAYLYSEEEAGFYKIGINPLEKRWNVRNQKLIIWDC